MNGDMGKQARSTKTKGLSSDESASRTPYQSLDNDRQQLEGTRRRLIRGASVVVPVVLTLTSRSVLATATQCLSPSATASINLLKSRPDRARVPCTGRTPGYWFNANSTHPTDWAAAGAEGVLFSSLGAFGSGFGSLTLLQVMGLTGNQDQYQLGAHLSAAWCNLKSGKVPDSVLSLSTLQAMWKGTKNGGSTYSPTAGVTWNGENVVTYLKTTMPL